MTTIFVRALLSSAVATVGLAVAGLCHVRPESAPTSQPETAVQIDCSTDALVDDEPAIIPTAKADRQPLSQFP
jgi:hypothetical protein